MERKTGWLLAEQAGLERPYYATIKGFELMRALRNGQAGMFNVTGGIRGEVRLVERAFGLGPCALTELMHLMGDHLQAE